MADEVQTLDVGFLPDAGTPQPRLQADELTTTLTFLGQPTSGGDRTAVVVDLVRCMVSTFGYPNDEALHGHPLYATGLRHYGVFEVIDSSWKRRIIEQNRRCFPRNPPHYETLRHFVITFHGSTFECLAQALVVRSAERHR